MTKKHPRFKTMAEAHVWVKKYQVKIPEYECPMFDKPHPKMRDLELCGSICESHWSCHTWGHLMGTREADDPLVPEVVEFT